MPVERDVHVVRVHGAAPCACGTDVQHQRCVGREARLADDVQRVDGIVAEPQRARLERPAAARLAPRARQAHLRNQRARDAGPQAGRAAARSRRRRARVSRASSAPVEHDHVRTGLKLERREPPTVAGSRPRLRRGSRRHSRAARRARSSASKRARNVGANSVRSADVPLSLPDQAACTQRGIEVRAPRRRARRRGRRATACPSHAACPRARRRRARRARAPRS